MGRSPHTRPRTTPALPTSARRTLTSSCRPTARSPVSRAQTGMCERNYKHPTNVTPGIPDCCPDVSFTEGILFRGGGPHFDLFHPRRPSSSLCHEIIPWHSEAFVFQPTWSLQGLVAGRKVTSCFFSIYCLCFWGFLCAFGNFSSSLSAVLAKSDEYMYKLADNLLDAMTNGEHSKSLKETEPVSVTS